MTSRQQQENAEMFRLLHERADDGILVLPNAWDPMSARLIEDAGARAIATTSAGVSWSLGRTDGQGATRDEMVAAVGRIASAVRVPVTADIEGGYGSTADAVAECTRQVIAAGAIGINLEDGPGTGGDALLDPAVQAERIAAARAVAVQSDVSVFINARVDVYMRRVGRAGERFKETIRRAEAYIGAGADGVFVPGVSDAATIRRLVGEIDAPVNIMAGPGTPSISELRGLGVARVSVGPAIALAVMTLVRDAASELLEHGTYNRLADGLSFVEADSFFLRTRSAIA